MQLPFVQSAILCNKVYDFIKINGYDCISSDREVSGFRICSD